MKYPLQLQEIRYADASQTLWIPDINAVRKAYEEGELKSFPYWAAVWPSAMAMASFLHANPHLYYGKIVLEIAAGLGLPSLVVAKLAKEVHCTDIDAAAMEIAQQSATHNQCKNMHCQCMNWNDIDDTQEPDLLLLSDVNYEAKEFAALLRLLENFLTKGSTILLTTPQRLMAKPFIEKLLGWCVQKQCMHVQAPDGKEADVMVMVLKR